MFTNQNSTPHLTVMDGWDDTWFDGSNEGAKAICAGYGVPDCDMFLDDESILTTLRMLDQSESPLPEASRPTPRRNRRERGQIRPRVPKDRIVTVSSTRIAKSIVLSLPRSRKITPKENKATMEKISEIEAELRAEGLLEKALAGRRSAPIKYVFALPNPELQASLNRKALDHYHKRFFAWNAAELDRLKRWRDGDESGGGGGGGGGSGGD